MPGSAPGQLHDVAGDGAFIPPGPEKTPRIGGGFSTDSRRFRRFRGKRWGVLEAFGPNARISSNGAGFSARQSLHMEAYRKLREKRQVKTKQLYHFTSAKYALKAIRDRRLKATELDKTNDPFELQPYRSETQESFQEYSRWRTAMSWAMLCLSETYKNPLLWGHYADRCKGICLGFDVITDDGGPVPRAFQVDYQPVRVKSGYKHPQIGDSPFLLPGLNYGLVKFRGWEYEKEWRIWGQKDGLESDPVAGLYYFAFESWLTLCQILIGPYCEEDDIKRRLETLTAGYPDPKPKIISTRLASSTFEIEKAT